MSGQWARSSTTLVVWLAMALAGPAFADEQTQPESKRPLAQLVADQGIREIVFALRQPGKDPHWYANFSYYADDEHRLTYGNGGKLCRMNLATGAVTAILADKQGAVRDPAVHYDAQRILFSYRRGGSPYYHLYEIDPDGGTPRQLTDGPYDDIEPCYMPDGTIIFISSRCNRWVNCWLTKVATMHRCDGDGGNIRAISANIEQDNTPWPLPDGRVLYLRWEYVDRSQVDYHHLWTANPDGTAEMVYFGNLHPGTVMIDAKPIPNTQQDRGDFLARSRPARARRRDQCGRCRARARTSRASPGPSAARPTTRDPWAFSEDLFMAAHRKQIVLVDGKGRAETIYRVTPEEEAAGLECHEPRPLMPRPASR